MPTWDARNLDHHYSKRVTRDAGCFEDLLGINGQPMTQLQYEQKSLDTYNNAWGEYEGEGRNVEAREYYPPSAYFVDDDLVVAITDTGRAEFLTCFHEHFGRPHGRDPGAGASVGQRQLRYRLHLRRDEQGGMIRKVKLIRGF
jgi:hypothetical protein